MPCTGYNKSFSRLASQRFVWLLAFCLLLLLGSWISGGAYAANPLTVPRCMKLARSKDLHQAADLAGMYWGLPQGLLGALAEKESNWNVEALGKKGERGLTQVRPSTIAMNLGWAADKKTLADIDERLRTEPLYALCWGARILHQSIELADGNVIAGLAAYNRGDGPTLYALDILSRVQE